ncbi:MAG: winged helix-turn-helix domain-containing protein [Bryobacteraceae bacterium]|nr:winged helix-turn-helix domain-containing protein [Bryobacteraceae bacterium]
MPAGSVHEFGPFRYDAGQRLLFRGDELVPLVPKVVDTLHVLLERRGTVVEKPELMRLVWPDTTVEEVGLARNISLLRKALGDDAEEYIETIPRRGYRFVAAAGTPNDVTPFAPPRSRRWKLAAAALAMAGVAALAYYFFYVPSRFVPPSRTAYLAVVPFECLCPGIDGEQFTRGLTEVMVAEFSKHQELQVVSPSTVARYQRARVSMAWMGRLLGLHVLIEGTVQHLDGRVRVTSRLVDVHTGRVIWSEAQERPAADLGQVQADVGRAVADAASERLSRR